MNGVVIHIVATGWESASALRDLVASSKHLYIDEEQSLESWQQERLLTTACSRPPKAAAGEVDDGL